MWSERLARLVGLFHKILAAVDSRLPAGVRKPLHGIWRVLVTTAGLYSEIDGEQRAASFAYYVLFSLFPFVALLLTIGSLFVSPDQVINGITSFLPLDLAQQQPFWDAVHNLEVARGGIGAISVVILLWSSLRFFLGLIRAVNRAWHTTEIPWWQLPLKNLLMIAIMGSALIAALLVPALLQGARDSLVAAEHFVAHQFPLFNLHLASTILDLVRYLIGGALLFYAFTMLYMLSPRRRVRFQQVWLPALLVTFALQGCQVAFVSYLPRVINYGLYGVIGSLMLLLLWVYVSGIIIIMGGCLCAAADKIWNEAIIPTNSED